MQDAISALFTENATLEILGRGVFIGSDRIYEYMRRSSGAPQVGTLFNHMQLGPVVHYLGRRPERPDSGAAARDVRPGRPRSRSGAKASTKTRS